MIKRTDTKCTKLFTRKDVLEECKKTAADFKRMGLENHHDYKHILEQIAILEGQNGR